jgi:hypothetical protein
VLNDCSKRSKLEVSTCARAAGFFCHLLLDDRDGALKSPDHIHKLSFLALEIGCLLLADLGGLLQLGLVRGNSCGQLLDL